jgi:hypothetical protein
MSLSSNYGLKLCIGEEKRGRRPFSLDYPFLRFVRGAVIGITRAKPEGG